MDDVKTISVLNNTVYLTGDGLARKWNGHLRGADIALSWSGSFDALSWRLTLEADRISAEIGGSCLSKIEERLNRVLEQHPEVDNWLKE